MIDPEAPEALPRATNRALRQFAALWLLACGGLAGWLGLAPGKYGLALMVAGLGIPVGIAGLVRPRAIGPLFTGLTTMTSPLGWVVTRILLALLFYGLFTPLALLFRLIGRDALARRRRPDQPTCWVPRPAPTDVRSYLRES